MLNISWIYIFVNTDLENVATKIPIFQKQGAVCLLVLVFAFPLYELLSRSEISAYVYNIPLVMQEVMPTVDHHSTTPAMLRVTTTVQNQSSEYFFIYIIETTGFFQSDSVNSETSH